MRPCCKVKIEFHRIEISRLILKTFCQLPCTSIWCLVFMSIQKKINKIPLTFTFWVQCSVWRSRIQRCNAMTCGKEPSGGRSDNDDTFISTHRPLAIASISDISHIHRYIYLWAISIKTDGEFMNVKNIHLCLHDPAVIRTRWCQVSAEHCQQIKHYCGATMGMSSSNQLPEHPLQNHDQNSVR